METVQLGQAGGGDGGGGDGDGDGDGESDGEGRRVRRHTVRTRRPGRGRECRGRSP